jgi:type II secretory pathway pseudopilin PulG
MRSCTDARRGGFVLMEAVIALSIIALVAVALLGTTAAQVRTADKGALLLTARALAEERLATVRALGWDELHSLPDSLAAGTFPPPFEAYSWRAEVEPVRDEYALFSVGVVVLVAGEAFTLSTLLHEPRPQVAAGAPQQFAPTPFQTRQ